MPPACDALHVTECSSAYTHTAHKTHLQLHTPVDDVGAAPAAAPMPAVAAPAAASRQQQQQQQQHYHSRRREQPTVITGQIMSRHDVEPQSVSSARGCKLQLLIVHLYSHRGHSMRDCPLGSGDLITLQSQPWLFDVNAEVDSDPRAGQLCKRCVTVVQPLQ
jgi:hypothetical protein